MTDPQVFEVSPPPGNVPLPFGVTYNPSTQKFRCFASVDANGDVSLSSVALVNATVNGLPLNPSYQEVTVTLTAAQIKNMSVTLGAPVLLVPAPGVGKFIRLISVDIHSIFGTTAFLLGSTLNLSYGGAAGASLVGNCSNTVLTQNQNALGLTGLTLGSVVTNYATLADNKGLFIQASGAQFTVGDGTAKVVVRYSVETF